MRRPRRSTLFPYTTLFRSRRGTDTHTPLRRTNSERNHALSTSLTLHYRRFTMSLITAVENVAKKIIADEKSTAAWLEKEVTVIEGKAPTIEKVIDTTLTYVGPALTIALDA